MHTARFFLFAALIFPGAVVVGLAQEPPASPAPDLLANQPVFATLQKSDGFYRLQFSVRNIGDAEADCANVAIALYQSADKFWDGQDLQINGQLPVSAEALAPQKSADGVLRGRLNFQGELNYQKMRKKTPYLILVVDPFFQLEEPNEFNNVRVIELPTL